MGKGTTELGYRNRNGQVVIRATHLPGTDRYQYVYVLRCGVCGHEYGATAPTYFSASAPVIRAALRGSPSNSLEVAFRRNPFLRRGGKETSWEKGSRRFGLRSATRGLVAWARCVYKRF